MDVRELVRRALDEDGVERDLTTLATVPEAARARGIFLAKDDIVVSGFDVAGLVFETVDARVTLSEILGEGTSVTRGTTIGRVEGPARALLQAERVALNFLQRTSGVATLNGRHPDVATLVALADRFDRDEVRMFVRERAKDRVLIGRQGLA